ncbi:MAG: prolipoprotein diacylglyceryl transferase [Vallitaleaceae bacterium]|nr:prolipoprotein diacylglyceryl transferase [Vallitaleaceae bacterium]
MNPDIVFPNLNLEFEHINPIAFTIFNIPIYWYAICIVSGVISGLYLARYRAKKNGEDPEIYSDFLVYALIAAIIGARAYYVIFSFDDYKDNLMDIFAFREGGLAIYGGVIGAVLALYLYTKKKKLSFWQMADTAAPGLALGQVLGRIGNFMNMEAFGGPTNSLFAMGLKAEKAKIPSSMISYIAPLEGYTDNYLLVQPTFAYEALWNIMVIILLSFYTKHKKFNGEIFMGYLLLYGIGRGIIEGLRTDQLLILNTDIPISQLLAWLMVLGSGIYIFYKRKKIGN